MTDHAADIKAINVRLDSLRELIDERDRRYEERDVANKAAVSSALKAVEKASDQNEATTKEQRQQQNEWRLTVTDIISTRAVAKEVDRQFDELKKEVSSLRESRSATSGRDEAIQIAKANQKWVIGMGITLLLFILGNLFALFKP